MLKNALEATSKGGEAVLSAEADNNYVYFNVKNKCFIPRDIQMQIFQRSFSTKCKGRGLGTYSMKLLGEKYLKGRISYKSSEDEGTVFTAAFPLKLKTE